MSGFRSSGGGGIGGRDGTGVVDIYSSSRIAVTEKRLVNLHDLRERPNGGGGGRLALSEEVRVARQNSAARTIQRAMAHNLANKKRQAVIREKKGGAVDKVRHHMDG